MNILLNLDKEIKKWLITHSTLPKIVYYFINRDRVAEEILLSDYINESLSRSVCSNLKIETKQVRMKKQNKTIIKYKQEMKDDNYYLPISDVKLESETKIIEDVTTHKGKWEVSSTCSYIKEGGLVTDVHKFEAKEGLFEINLVDNGVTLIKTEKMKMFLDEFKPSKLTLNTLEDFNYVSKNLQRLVEHDRLLDLIISGRVKIDTIIVDDVIIEYESKINKLECLLKKEATMLKNIEQQRLTIQQAKDKLMRDTDEYTRILVNPEEKEVVLVDKSLFFASMLLSVKENARKTAELRDVINDGLRYYEVIMKADPTRVSGLSTLLEWCGEVELENIRIKSLEGDYQRVDTVDGFNDESDVDDEYEDDFD
jgi:hypothetical protein